MKKTMIMLACFAVAGQAAFAGIVYNQDYEGLSVGTIGSATGLGGGGVNNYIVRSDETGTPFGAGNKWLQLKAQGNPWTYAKKDTAGSSTAMLSFDLYKDGAAGDSWLRAGLSRTSNDMRYMDTGSGTANVTLPSGTVTHFDIVGNITGATLDNGLGGSIAGGYFDIFQNGGLVAHLPANASSSGNLDGFVLWMNSGGAVSDPRETMAIDNLVYQTDMVNIPEPATFGLLGLASAGLYFARKFRMV